MKKLKFGMLLIPLLVSFISCNSDANDSIDEKGTITKNKNLGTFGPLLFNYSNSQECFNNVKNIIPQLAKSDSDELLRLTNIDRISNIISINNGQCLLTHKHYIDLSRRIIVRSEILNLNTMQYQTVNINQPLNNEPTVPTTGCLPGSTSLGTCTGAQSTNSEVVSAYANCIGNATASYQLQHMNTNNGFAMITVGGTTTICAYSQSN